MHIHILGIAGTMTAHLAASLKKKGFEVTGSDQEKIFPPISTTLKKANIKINSVDITKNINLAIVGSSYDLFENTKNEFEQIKKLKIPYISATQYLAKKLVKENSVVIAGSFGKTTITSLVSWIFSQANKKPNYMFGGNPKNKYESIKFSDSEWSVIEGDESIHGLDKMAKFLYYPTKYLLITSADWEHKDSYPSEKENFNAFKKLVDKIPENGYFFVNQKSQSANDLIPFSKGQVVTYNTPNSDYFIEKAVNKSEITTLIIRSPRGVIKINTILIGQFNFENILAAVTLCDTLNISQGYITKAVFSYKGIKRRLELVANYKNILFFDDFAQSGNRIQSTLSALKNHFPNRNIKVLYQPHASFSQYKSSLCDLKPAFENTSEVVLMQLKFNQNIGKNNRNTAKDFRDCLGTKLIYLPLKKQILKYYKDSLMPNDILIYMSSGGLEGNRIFKSIINSFRK